MYHKELFVFDQDKPLMSVIRNYTLQDFDELIAIQAECFPPPFSSELWWNKKQLTNHVTIFPEGSFCVEVDGELAGSITSLMTNFDPDQPGHQWEKVTDSGYIRNHNNHGNTLYIVDISIRPKYRKLGLGKWLMQSMYHVVIEKGLDRLLGGGRMPGYHKVSHQMTADEYLEAVVKGRLKDPVLTFLLRCGRTPVGLVANYLEDEESCNYATLMEWKNPFKSNIKGIIAKTTTQED